MFTPEATRALVMSLIAGLSTLIGTLVVFAGKKENEKLVSVSLGFAAGVMLSVSFSDLLPSARTQLESVVSSSGAALLSVLFMISGIGMAALIDKLTPQHEQFDESTGEAPHKNLFHVGFVSMLAIGLHNFPEGIATFMAGYEDATLGISIAAAIALHNIPEGVSVAMPIYYATGSRKLAFKYTFLSGIAEPVGALLAFLVLRPFISPMVLGALFALVAGIMLYIALEELIPSSRQYGFDKAALVSTLAGSTVMLLTHAL